MPIGRGRRGVRGGRGTSRGGRGARTTRPLKATVKKYKKRQARPKKESSGKPKETEILNLDVNKDATEYFSKNATYDQHYDAQVTNRDKYVATIMAFQNYSIEIIANARARSLAAAFARRDQDLMNYLLEHNSQFGFADVLKAVTILDSQREKRSIEKKLTEWPKLKLK